MKSQAASRIRTRGSIFTAAILAMACSAATGCGEGQGGSGSEAVSEGPTAFYATLDPGHLQALAAAHFEWVAERSLTAGNGGYGMTSGEGPDRCAMQHMSVEGRVSTQGIKAALFDLHRALLAHVQASGAEVIGGLGAPWEDRPLPSWAATWSSLIPPEGVASDLDTPRSLGFYVEYSSAGITGSVNVIATRVEPEESGLVYRVTIESEGPLEPEQLASPSTEELVELLEASLDPSYQESMWHEGPIEVSEFEWWDLRLHNLERVVEEEAR